MTSKTKIAERYFEKPKWLKTQSGIPVKETYTPDDTKPINYATDIAGPGEFPYVRGIFPSMYRGRMWSIREISGLDSPRATNKRLRHLIGEGESALNIIVDIPSQYGFDSDHPRVEASVGLMGVPACSLRDWEIMMDGIPLGEVSTTLSTLFMPSYIFFLGAAQKQGVPLEKIRGTFLNDPLTYRLVGYFPPSMPQDIALRMALDTILFCCENAPLVYPLSVGGQSIRECGATAAQEIAFDFCVARHYIKEALKRGADVDYLGPKVTFTHRVGVDIFEEAAKFRAARQVWAKLMRDELGAKNPRSWTYKVHVVTKGSDLIAKQPENNIIRIAYQALAAVLGGVQSMHTTSFDEPICLPTEESVRIAVRTQQILAYETGAVNVADPLGGSYYVEWLTNELQSQITKIMDEFKEAIAEALESGRLREILQKEAQKYQQEVENRERTVVGLNAFTTAEEEEREAQLHTVCEEEVKEHLENLKELRKTRDTTKAKESLENLCKVAEIKEENLCPAVLEAAKAYATLGEIMGAIRLGYGYDYDPFGELEYPF